MQNRGFDSVIANFHFPYGIFAVTSVVRFRHCNLELPAATISRPVCAHAEDFTGRHAVNGVRKE